MLVLGLVLALPAIAHFLLGALATLEARLAARPEWLLFPAPGREAELEALAARLGADPRVAELRRRSAEENLAELLAMPGFAGVEELLAENPLPPVLLLAPRPELAQAEREALRAELAARPELAGLLPAADGREALRALSARLRLLLAPFALLVGLGALAVLFAVLQAVAARAQRGARDPEAARRRGELRAASLPLPRAVARRARRGAGGRARPRRPRGDSGRGSPSSPAMRSSALCLAHPRWGRCWRWSRSAPASACSPPGSWSAPTWPA
ncbi:MAG: hypothetical protein RML12_00590 [Xanthomonadales bacterium]|nr:hypothetical protein [Xanthomonadales bacterium]